VHKVLDLVKEVKKFPLFAGPRLSSVTARWSIALVGDASHRKFVFGSIYYDLMLICRHLALSGAFGESFR